MLKAFEMNMKGERGISRRSLRPLFGSHLHPFVQSKANGGQEAAGVRCPFLVINSFLLVFHIPSLLFQTYGFDFGSTC